MNFKKVITSTSSLFVSALLLSKIYSYSSIYFQPKSIDLSAFRNLASNVSTITQNESNAEILENEKVAISSEIIKVIDKEISLEIKKSRKALLSLKIKNNLAKNKPIKSDKQNFTEDLSSFEINNKELIVLSGFEIDKNEYSQFPKSQLAKTNSEELKDEVAVKIASTENIETTPVQADEVKIVQHAQKKEESDDMVMFEYSDKVAENKISSRDIDSKLYDRPISNTVKNAISREIGNKLDKKMVTMNTHRSFSDENKVRIDNQDIDLNSPDAIVYDYSADKKLVDNDKENAFLASPKMDTHEIQFLIKAKELNLNTQKTKQVYGFEFIPDYDRAERINDSTTGEIVLGYPISGEVNNQTGIIQSQGLIPTRVELSLGAMKGLEVPLLNENGIQKFLQKQNLSIEGNLVLIALNSNIIDTEIDSSFGAKLYFDKNFKQTQQFAGSSFVLFAGVKTGNILIKYQLSNKENAQKIIYVGDGELFFDDPSFFESERETYTFNTRSILGTKKKELSIDGSDIRFFNTTITAKKKAINAYEIKVPSMVTGMRKYLEFKHLNDSIFVGTSSEKEIEVPGNDFIAKVLEMNQINSLKERCIVQLNLQKNLRAISANGKNRSGEMFVETSFLDKDGNFSRDNSEMADMAFVVGDMEGQLSVKLDYTDGSSEFIKTFCSEGSYLVEQL